MANLAQIVSNKQTSDEAWKAKRQAERDNADMLQDTGISVIVSSPEEYARYLDLQSANPTYSVGNIALAMAQNPNITQFGTKERWATLGRSISDGEIGSGVQIYARGSFGKGYVLTEAYDVSQTYGREVSEIKLESDTPQMETALKTLMNYSAVPVVIEENMSVPAFYDEGRKELAIQPNVPDEEAFSAIAAEVAHSRFHDKGRNQYYDRKDSELDAQSVSYILCKRFGVQRDLPADIANLDKYYGGWNPDEARRNLDRVQDMSKQIGGSIQRDLTPQEHTRGSHTRRPAR